MRLHARPAGKTGRARTAIKAWRGFTSSMAKFRRALVPVTPNLGPALLATAANLKLHPGIVTGLGQTPNTMSLIIESGQEIPVLRRSSLYQGRDTVSAASRKLEQSWPSWQEDSTWQTVLVGGVCTLHPVFLTRFVT